MADHPRILAFSTQGTGGNDELRLRALLTNFRVEYFPFDYAAKRNSLAKLRRALRDCDLAVMEGTGIAGGLALLSSGRPFVVSSGDAVGPFIASKSPLLAPLFSFYERLLCRRSRGFIGWTPYLTGRALTFGAPRAMTAAGWSPHDRPGRSLRTQLGISPDSLVIGIVGALDWNTRAGYCYGWELARALDRVARKNVVALIVGGGSGMEKLSGERVILTGPVPRAEIPDYLATMDIASLPQSCDQLGSFRYSTKLPEYVAAKLPVVTGQLPMAYDLDCGWMWRLPGRAPWDPAYIRALAELLDRVTDADIASRRAAIPVNPPEFDRDRQIRRVTNFIGDILSSL
jgi:hypothetical protein